MPGLGEKVRESTTAMGRVFRSTGLRRMAFAFAGSIIGDWAFAVVISLYAYDKGGATALGVVGVVRYLTMAVLAPVLSTLADRYRRKRVMIGADLARAALVGTVALLVATDGPELTDYTRWRSRRSCSDPRSVPLKPRCCRRSPPIPPS